ncbi:MAG: hypothetical protein HS119_06125 [Flavobacteriales bacterium]|nr:hypothetical protein [Flavobacteriales bacterium]
MLTDLKRKEIHLSQEIILILEYQAKKAGRNLKNYIEFVLNQKANEIRSFDFEAQCRSVFENVRSILEESGSSWENIGISIVFLTDMKRDFKTYNRLYAEYFKTNQPCRTTVEVNALPSPICIELKCIATV